MTMSILWLTGRERRWTAATVRELVRAVGARRARPAVLDTSVPAPIVAIGVRRHAPRPAPVLRWTVGRSAPVGDFAASAIPNDSLRPSDIPSHGASWEAVADFARSYDGYAYWNNLPDLASSSVRCWTRDRTLPDTIDELRACLFYEHRRWHHFGEEPSGRAAEYAWAIVDAISALTTTRYRPPAATAGHRGAQADPKVADPKVADPKVADPKVADPRVVVASEAHVRIIAPNATGSNATGSNATGPNATGPDSTGPDANGAPAAAHTPASARPRPRPRPARPTLQPVPAAEAHVQLVKVDRPLGTVVPIRGADPASESDTTSEADPWVALTTAVLASVKARHPSAGTVQERAGGHDGSVQVLRPMPSPEPLPKPSVIQRRPPTEASHAATRGPDALVVPLQPRRVAARCETFECDDDGYDAWLCANPQGYVLNVAAKRTKGMVTLHRAVCPTVTTARRGQAMTGTPKVCDTSRQALHQWAVVQDTEPASCQRCRP